MNYSHEDAMEKYFSNLTYRLEIPAGTPAQVGGYIGNLMKQAQDLADAGGLQAIDYGRMSEVEFGNSRQMVFEPKGIVAQFRARELRELLQGLTSTQAWLGVWIAVRVLGYSQEETARHMNTSQPRVSEGVGVVDRRLHDYIENQEWTI